MDTAYRVEAALDRYADFDPPFPHWLGGDHADQGSSYCEACAVKAVEAGEGEYVDGGCDAEHNAGGPVHCEGCGKRLDYVLDSVHGVGQEMAHFEAFGFRTPLTRDEAYCIARMVEAAPDDAAVLDLASRAVHAIPVTPELIT